MKNSKIIYSSLLGVITIVLCGILVTSSTTIEQSESEVIAQLSAELTDMKKEVNGMKAVVNEETSYLMFL